MAIVESTYANNLKLSQIELPDEITNTPIKIGIGKITATTVKKLGVIPNPLFELEQQKWKERDLERELKIKKQWKEIDNDGSLSDYKKYAIKKLVEKFDGRYKLETIKKYVSEIEHIRNKEKELIECWEFSQLKRPSVFWNLKKDGRHIEPAQIWYTRNNEKRIIPAQEILDDNYGKKKKRNDTIAKIREKYRSKTLMGTGNYENSGYYGYKSPKAYRQFLEEIEQKGLTREPEVKQTKKEVYDPVDGFYHYKLPFPTTKINALDLTSQKDIVEPNNYFYNEETGDYEILREDEL